MITLHVKKTRDGSPRNLDDRFVAVQVEILDVLEAIDSLPALGRLAQMDIYDDVKFEGEALTSIRSALCTLLGDFDRLTAEVSIPDWVGRVHDLDKREPFGRARFRTWLLRAKELCDLALERDTYLLAAGD